MKRRILSLLLLFVLAFSLLAPATIAFAQTYAFTVRMERVDVYWESDGTQTLEYEILFENADYADPIDYVDIGFPNDTYSTFNTTASIDGQTINSIAPSAYVESGVELYLGANAIQPGDTGTVRVRTTGISDVLYTDNLDDTYVSAVFAPNYFGDEFVIGTSDISITYHLPPGVQASEPRWHPAPDGFPEQPVTGVDDEGRITYTWRNQNASAAEFYLFGASFPKNYVPASVITEPSFFQRYGIDPELIIPFVVCCCIGLFLVAMIWIGVVADRRRRMQYLPPKIAIEGHGIKRGLTAPEAAILLEQPMDKIMTMILFSVIKKGAAQVAKQEPLELAIKSPTPTGLRDYEDEFLLAFMEGDTPKRRRALQQMMVSLVKGVANKMKGFSKRETLAFYKTITEEAWQQVEAAKTPKVQSKLFDENLEWTMLDPNYDDRTRDVFTGRTVYAPHWYRSYVPIGSPSAPRAPSVSTGGAKVSLPTLPGGDFAASIAGGVQNFAGGLLGSLSDFTGGVTKVTNPPPPPSRSGGGSFSGGGSSCACACAGCACACAGGGR